MKKNNMGYSNLTRYELYKNAYRTINEVDNLFIKTEEIKQLFYNSAVIIEGFEPRILEDREVTLSDFENLLLRNMERIDLIYLNCFIVILLVMSSIRRES